MKSRRLDLLSQSLRTSRVARRMTERAKIAASVATGFVRGFLDGSGHATNGHNRRVEPIGTTDGAKGERASLADHLGALVEKRLERLSQCRQWQSSDDPVEAIHDLRVASRRLRAFVDVFRPLLDADVYDRTERPLRRITRAARSIRDLDVQTSLLVERLDRAASDAERAALEHLLEELETGRSRAERRAKKRLSNVDFAELRVSISTALGETVARLPHDRPGTAALALDLIQPFIDQASRDRPPDDGLEYPDEMHLLRIDLKKLRYGLELFEPAFGEHYEPLHDRVEALQELLGHHHDLVVLGGVVEEHAERLKRKNRSTLIVGLDTLNDELSRERRQLLARFRTDGFEPDWWERSVRSALASA